VYQKDDDEKTPSQATLIVGLVVREATLWHTPDNDGFATIDVGDHREHWAIKSKAFRQWVQRLFYRANGKACNAQALQDALGVIEGQAIFDGVQHQTFVRVAQHEGEVFIDLADDKWQAIKITPQGVKSVSDPPVKFRRPKAMLPLPMPIKGGKVSDLRQFINVADPAWPLITGWMVQAFYPQGPYPSLCLSAEQGSGKSTASRVLRSLIDPNTSPLRAEPRDPRDLMIAAANGWVVSFDNLSHVPAWLSDALCRLSTGGGFSTRMLYENDQEMIFDAMRPSILNGIEEISTRSDLIDRSIIVSLPSIPENRRRPEKEFWATFEAARPAIFGALLSAVGVAMRNLPTTTLECLPRMADFALLATAAEPKLGLKPGEFMAAYQGNRADANTLAIEACPISRFVLDLATTEAWQGTAAELLAELDHQAGFDDRHKFRPKGWPSGPRPLAGILKRLAPNLRRAGIMIDFSQETTGRRRKLIRICPDICDSVRSCDSSDSASDQCPPATVNLGQSVGVDESQRVAKIPPYSAGVSVGPGGQKTWTA